MANECYYRMKVVGKEVAVRRLYDLLHNRSPDIHGRIFSADWLDEGVQYGKHYIEFEGDCAWSVLCCMTDGYVHRPNVQSYIEDHELTAEVFSEELGCEFQEHFVFDSSGIVESECVDYCEYFIDDCTNADISYILNSNNITEEDLIASGEDGEHYRIGGYDSWEFSI